MNLNSSVYYQGNYWNDLEVVRSYLNLRSSGSTSRSWVDVLREVHPKPFEHPLVLNCGNGWVERDLFRDGVIRRVTGVDCSKDLLSTARHEAARVNMSADYIEADINQFRVSGQKFDLVLNYAAGHHIAYLDRVLRQVNSVLCPDGLFVSYDYTGAHRNQYSAYIWERIHAVNQNLPERYRTTLTYPHLPTMLVADPTEAVHSELFLETKLRYFDFLHFRKLGGAIAYPLLTFNQPFFAEPAEDRDAVVEGILQFDAAEADRVDGESLFSFVIARPRDLSTIPYEHLAKWTIDEESRESIARNLGGKYYPPTVVGFLSEMVESLTRFCPHRSI